MGTGKMKAAPACQQLICVVEEFYLACLLLLGSSRGVKVLGASRQTPPVLYLARTRLQGLCFRGCAGSSAGLTAVMTSNQAPIRSLEKFFLLVTWCLLKITRTISMVLCSEALFQGLQSCSDSGANLVLCICPALYFRKE